MTTMISPRKTRSGSTRGSASTSSHVNTSIPGPSSSSSSSGPSHHSAISKPSYKDRPAASLIPIRPASTRQPFRPTVRQASNATLPPAGPHSSLEGTSGKPLIGLKPPTLVRETHASRGPSYTLNLKGSALLRQEIRPKPVPAPRSRDAEEESADESCNGMIEEEKQEDQQPTSELLVEEASQEEPVASSSSQPLPSSSSLGSPPRLSSPFTRRALLSSDDNRPSSSASASTALSDIETDTAASVVSSPDLSDSASEGSSSDRDDDAGEDVTTSTRTTRARSRTPVFFGTPSKDEQEQRRRYSRRVRERRVLRRDSLELARRKTLTLEEVEDAARAFREEKAAAEAASQGGAIESADSEAGQGHVFDERAPSPHLTPVRPQQTSVTEDHLPQDDELDLQQAKALELQQADELEVHQQASADPSADFEDREQVHVPSDGGDALDSVIVDDEEPVVLSQEAYPEDSDTPEAEETKEEATEAGQDLESGSDLPVAEADDFVVVDVADSAEASMRQEEEEDGPIFADEETHPQGSASREEELAIDDQELHPQEPTSPEETTEATAEVPISEEDEPSPLTEALKNITNVPNHKEEDLQNAEAQYEADAPEDDSVASVSEETLPEETGPLELPAVQEAALLDSEKHSADATSAAAAVAVDELYVPTSHLYIPDVMDQTLAFDRLEEEVGDALAEEEGEESVLLATQEAQQLHSVQASLTPPEGHWAPEENEEDSPGADAGDMGKQDTGTPSTAPHLCEEPQASSASPNSNDAIPGADDQLLLTTEDETLAFEIAEGLLTGATPSVEDSMREAIELSLSEDPVQLEQASVGIEEASDAGDIREDTLQQMAEQEQSQGQGLVTQGSPSPTTLVSVPASPAPATPTPAAPDTSSASFMMDSPGVGLSFRRRYDENVLASAAKRAQQSFALGAHYAQSPANESLKSLKASPMPLSLSNTPLGERNANISYGRREIELSPTLKNDVKADHSLRPLSSRLESPARATEEADHQVSPHMRRMMDIRDAMLMASPTKSPRKPPMRVTVPSPQKAEAMSSTTASLGSPGRKTDVSPVTQTFEPSKLEEKAAETGVSTAPASNVADLFKRPELSQSEKDVATQLSCVSSKAPPSTASASRLPKLASGNSRIAKPTSVGSIRAPTAIPSARSQSAQSSSASSSQLARPSVPSQTTGQSNSGNPFQKKAAPKAVAPASSLSRPPSAADSIGSSNSSLNGPSKEKTLKDPRVPPVSSAPPASAGSSNGPSAVKRTQPISALRKMQGTSQLSSFTHKTADWLKGSTADSSAQWTLGKSVLPSPALNRSTGSSAAVPEAESEAVKPAPASPVKASAMTAGSGRARRVLAGSKEATHAPSEAKGASIVRPKGLMSSTSSARTDSDLEGGARSDVALSSSPDKTARMHGDSIPPVMERPIMATYRKPSSSSSHGAKSLRVASGSSRKASRTGESAPSSSSVGPSPLSQASVDETPSSALDATGAKEDAVVKEKDIGHRSLSNPLAAAPARTATTARSASNPATAVVTTPPARASRAKVNDVVPSVPISSAALATLTTRNSRRNEIHLVKLSVVTIRIEGARPPSPSSKIRKSSLAEGAPPMEKGRADEARAVRARKRARESQESRMSAGLEAGERDIERGGVGVWRDPDFRGWETEMAQHRLGAGEEETYSTPLRVKKRTAGKGVRWRKNLFAAPASSSSMSSSASTPWKSNLVAKDYQLDRHGNARSGDAPPSPSWKRVRVTVRKIVYDDDEEEGDGGGESASAMVDGRDGLEKEGAASDSEYAGQL